MAGQTKFCMRPNKSPVTMSVQFHTRPSAREMEIRRGSVGSIQQVSINVESDRRLGVTEPATNKEQILATWARPQHVAMQVRHPLPPFGSEIEIAQGITDIRLACSISNGIEGCERPGPWLVSMV